MSAFNMNTINNAVVAADTDTNSNTTADANAVPEGFIRVLVGPGEKEFLIDKTKICSRSNFFRVCFNNPRTIESQTQTIRFPEDDPEVFYLFENFLLSPEFGWNSHWRLVGAVKFKDSWRQGLAWCIETYRFAHKIDAVLEKNFVIHAVYHWHILAGDPDPIWENALMEDRIPIQTSELYKLLTDYMAHDLATFPINRMTDGRDWFFNKSIAVRSSFMSQSMMVPTSEMIISISSKVERFLDGSRDATGAIPQFSRCCPLTDYLLPEPAGIMR